MLIVVAMTLSLAITATPDPEPESLFARLVSASARSDDVTLTRLLETETLSTSTIGVTEGNRLRGGPMLHGVPAAEIANKLRGCAVTRWRDVGQQAGEAFVLWECPNKRAPGTDCYFYSYRASMLDGRHHPANLFIHEMPSWDRRCGVRIPPPPQ